MPEPALPQPFGPYVLREWLGATAMAEAFLAVRAADGLVPRQLVVHRFLAPHGQDRRFGTLLASELRHVSKLTHPGVVRFRDAGAADGVWFIVTDYVQGLALHHWLDRLAKDRRVLPVGLACFIAAEVAASVAHAHEHGGADAPATGMVHGAIDSERVLISEAGEVQLTDFGVASALDRYRRAQGISGPALDQGDDLRALCALFQRLLPADPSLIPPLLRDVAQGQHAGARALRKAILDAARSLELQGDRESLADFLHIVPTTVLPVVAPVAVPVIAQAPVPAPVPAPASAARTAERTPAPAVPTAPASGTPASGLDAQRAARPGARLPVPANPLPRGRSAPTPLPQAPTPPPVSEARTRFVEAMPDDEPRPAPRVATPRPAPLPSPPGDRDDAPASWGLVAAATLVWVAALVTGVYAVLLSVAR